MAGQGSAASEGFLAVGIWAFVGSLAGVNSAVSSEGRRITEGLLHKSVSIVADWEWKGYELTFPQRSHM